LKEDSKSAYRLSKLLGHILEEKKSSSYFEDCSSIIAKILTVLLTWSVLCSVSIENV